MTTKVKAPRVQSKKAKASSVTTGPKSIVFDEMDGSADLETLVDACHDLDEQLNLNDAAGTPLYPIYKRFKIALLQVDLWSHEEN